MIIDNLPKEVQTEVWCIPDATLNDRDIAQLILAKQKMGWLLVDVADDNSIHFKREVPVDPYGIIDEITAYLKNDDSRGHELLDACADESYVDNYDSLRLFEIHDWLQIEE